MEITEAPLPRFTPVQESFLNPRERYGWLENEPRNEG